MSYYDSKAQNLGPLDTQLFVKKGHDLSILWKSIALLVTAAVVATMLERWFHLFWEGRLYDHLWLVPSILGFAAPVVAVVGGVFVAYKIIRA